MTEKKLEEMTEQEQHDAASKAQKEYRKEKRIREGKPPIADPPKKPK